MILTSNFQIFIFFRRKIVIIEDLVSGWRRYIDESALTIRQLDLDDVYLHDYDKFVKYPINEISKLCDFLGIDYESEMINVERREDKWFDVKENNPQ